MIILPTPPNGEESIEIRWQRACDQDDMCQWQSYSYRLMLWSRELFNAGDYNMASTLLFLSNMAYQRYLDLHPRSVLTTTSESRSKPHRVNSTKTI